MSTYTAAFGTEFVDHEIFVVPVDPRLMATLDGEAAIVPDPVDSEGVGVGVGVDATPVTLTDESKLLFDVPS
jgi:hypothetical protein